MYKLPLISRIASVAVVDEPPSSVTIESASLFKKDTRLGGIPLLSTPSARPDC